jgi:hypothetical protein
LRVHSITPKSFYTKFTFIRGINVKIEVLNDLEEL